MREVQVFRTEGPVRQEEPEDLVRLGATRLPGVREEHEVHLRLPVQLEGPKNLEPGTEGLGPCSSLQEGPTIGEVLEDPEEEHVLEPGESWVVDCFEVPEGRVLLPTRCLRSLHATRIYRRRCIVPPIHTRSCWARSLRSWRRMRKSLACRLSCWRAPHCC